MTITTTTVSVQQNQYLCDKDNTIVIFNNINVNAIGGSYIHICPTCQTVYNLPVQYPTITYS